MFPIYFWILLIVILIIAVFIDLGVALRSSSKMGIRSSLLLSSLWIFLAGVVGTIIYLDKGEKIFVEFLTSYFVELSLSIDNVFVFIMIFQYFKIGSKYQHKILFLGVLGAIIFRLLMITLGIYVVKMFEWIFIPFGILLIYSGYKLPKMESNEQSNLRENFVYRLAKKVCKIDDVNHKGRLFYKERGKWVITQLGLALLMIEKADLIFAFDSVPAVLAITNDSFIAFSSNVLAILGLRSMYFVLANALDKFYYLKHSIGYMLIYIGLKMILGFFGLAISNYVSIIVIISMLFSGIFVSVLFKKKSS